MRAGIIDYSADLLRWWAWEMRSLAGADRGRRRRRPVPPIRLSRAGVAIETPHGDIRQVAPEAAGAALRDAFGAGRPRRIDVVIEPDRYLLRRLSPLRLPRSRARAMAELDRGAATPLGADETHLVLVRPRAADPQSQYAVLRRDQIDPLLESLGAAGIALGDLTLAGPERLLLADGPSRKALAPASRRERVRRAALGLAAGVAIVGIVGLVGTAFWRQDRALATLDREIARIEGAADGVRADLAARQARLADIAALRRARSGALPMVQVLEELARLLPDGTWIETIEIDPQGVVLSGTSLAAADLIPRLAASALFHEPAFSQPVLREVGREGERFTIALGTGRADG